MTSLVHGSPSMIRRGCPCNLCVLVREVDHYKPPTGCVPAGPARDHLQALRELGWPWARLEEHIGYSEHTLYGIASGRHLFTSRYIAEDILSVPLKEVAA